ncbi:MAG: hypothetical protein AAFY31_11690, partial [Pseudomonadota bacterium]
NGPAVRHFNAGLCLLGGVARCPAQPCHRLFSLRALAARKSLQVLNPKHFGTAEKAVIRERRSEDHQGNSEVVERSDYLRAGMASPLYSN